MSTRIGGHGSGFGPEVNALAIEVTNAEYQAFLNATNYRGVPRYWKEGKYPKGKANHPVLFVSLNNAEAYCAWVSQETGWEIIVPSAEQWEKEGGALGPITMSAFASP
jgi:formylglycine-generating enzyme required for sulfatase activity